MTEKILKTEKHVTPEERLELLVSERDAKREAAISMAEQDDFNPEAEAYTSLRDRASALDAQIAQLRDLIAQREAMRALDRQGIGVPKQQAHSGARVSDADVYRPDGDRSFFRDSYWAHRGDAEAREYLDRHMRAMTTVTAGNGGGNIVPPQYLASLFAPDPKFGSPVAASFPQYQLPNGASPFKLPRQIVAGVVSNQAGENTPITPSDQQFDQITVTPTTKVGSSIFSRQLLDGSNPAIDQIVANDLRGELLEAIDTEATAALLATTGASVDTSADTAPALLGKIVLGIPMVYGLRKMPADMIYMSPACFGFLASAQDTEGRPLLNAYMPSNAYGAGVTADLATAIGGLPVTLAPQLADGAGTYKVIIAKRSDFGEFTSPLLPFRFEEKHGPESIEVGVWQYTAAMTGRYPTGVRVITHTIDSTP
jgi:HK97 family phage major capsid protein